MVEEPRLGAAHLSTYHSDDRFVRAHVRRCLPESVFRRSRSRSMLALPIIASIVGLSVVSALSQTAWWLALILAILIGNAYASLMFLGHEVGHGAVVRSRTLQIVLLYLGCVIFCFSPHLWRVWHNGAHHGHANHGGLDPDNFGTLADFERAPPIRRLLRKCWPGMGWIGLLYFFMFFTLQGQSVLWSKSGRMPGMTSRRHFLSVVDTLWMAAFWVVLARYLGPYRSVFVILIPMGIANMVVLGYVATNHMLMPLASDHSALRTSMGVRTLRVLDWLHLNFSHHVEHHLFPAVPSHRYPAIRRVLERDFSNLYTAPPHWRALLALLKTPRIYDGSEILVDPFTNRRVPISAVHADLKHHGHSERELRGTAAGDAEGNSV